MRLKEKTYFNFGQHTELNINICPSEEGLKLVEPENETLHQGRSEGGVLGCP